MSKIAAENVWVICVTYGDRTVFIDRMIQSTRQQGVKSFVFWCNGLQHSTQTDLRELAERKQAECGLRIQYIFKDQNVGPAVGYAGLVQYVLDSPETPDAVLFLDDDNLLGGDCMGALLSAAHQDVAVCAVRSDRSYLVHAAQTGEVSPAQPGEAFGFDFRKTFKRAWKKIRKIMSTQSNPVRKDNRIPVPVRRVPYGGLMVPYNLLQQVALPREEFIIYADDYDYSERLSEAGCLLLVPDAVVHDQEESWNASTQASPKISNLKRLATSPPDFRIYYALRNALVLDIERLHGRRNIWFSMNLIMLKIGVLFFAITLKRIENYWTIRAAIRDAREKCLGLNPEYPLPK